MDFIPIVGDAKKRTDKKASKKSSKSGNKRREDPRTWQRSRGKDSSPRNIRLRAQARKPPERKPIEPRKLLRQDMSIYLQEISDAIESIGASGTDGNEEMELLVDKALQTISGNEVEVSVHPNFSRLLEVLLAGATADRLVNFARNLSGSYIKMFQHKNASHVLEVLLKRASALGWGSIEDSVVIALTELQDRWIRIVVSRNGSYCTRTLIAAVWPEPGVLPKVAETLANKLTSNLMDTLVNELEERKLLLRDDSSLVVQEFLQRLPASSERTRLISSILEIGKRTDVVRDKFGGHVVETLMKVTRGDEALHMEVYDALLAPDLAKLALHGTANFVVKEIFHEDTKGTRIAFDAFKRLIPIFTMLMSAGRYFIVVGLLRTARGSLHVELQCTQKLREALGLEGGQEDYSFSDQFVRRLLVSRKEKKHKEMPGRRSAKDYTQGKTQPLALEDTFEPGAVTSGGSLILQELLRFSSEISNQCLEGLLGLDIRRFSRERFGAGAITVAVEVAPLEIQEDMIERLSGEFAGLAQDSAGSRVVSACYKHSRLRMKEKVVYELAERVSELQAGEYGSLVAKRTRVWLYSRDPRKWREEIKQGQRTQHFLEDITRMADGAVMEAQAQSHSQSGKKKRKAKVERDGQGNKKRRKDETEHVEQSKDVIDEHMEALGY